MNIDSKKLDSKKDFWQTFMLLLSNKCSNSARNVTLIDEEVRKCFNTYFVNIIDILKVERAPFITIDSPIEHPLHSAIYIIRIKERANDTI